MAGCMDKEVWVPPMVISFRCQISMQLTSQQVLQSQTMSIYSSVWKHVMLVG